MLIEAKAPILIAGQGVLYAEASDELTALADLLDLPVMTTTSNAKNEPLVWSVRIPSEPSCRPTDTLVDTTVALETVSSPTP